MAPNRLDKFLPHAPEYGFFLHIPTFRQNALLTAPFGDHSRPTPALLSVVYLWGVHISHSEALLLQEHAFLTRAVQHVATDMIGAHPNRVVHTLQAHILLAYYFFVTGRYLEAKCQSGSAVSLALGAGLHKLRSANVTALPVLSFMNDHTIRLQPHQSHIEEGERINAFWAALTLHKIISVALDPITICGAMEAPINIDVPWPLDMEQYAQVSQERLSHSLSTVLTTSRRVF
jgi:Fungal specific transcription factor domain